MKSVVGEAGTDFHGHGNKSASLDRHFGVTLEAIKTIQCRPRTCP